MNAEERRWGMKLEGIAEWREGVYRGCEDAAKVRTPIPIRIRGKLTRVETARALRNPEEMRPLHDSVIAVAKPSESHMPIPLI